MTYGYTKATWWPPALRVFHVPLQLLEIVFFFYVFVYDEKRAIANKENFKYRYQYCP